MQRNEEPSLSQVLSPTNAPSAALTNNGAILIPCPVCRHEVSSQAPTCPHCGQPIATADKPRILELAKALTAIVLGILVLCFVVPISKLPPRVYLLGLGIYILIIIFLLRSPSPAKGTPKKPVSPPRDDSSKTKL